MPRVGISAASAAKAVTVNAGLLAHVVVLLWWAQPVVQAQPARTSVVFFAPERLTPEVRSALEDALATQLSLLHAAVYYAGPANRDGDPSERVQSARRTAARYGAIAIFWLDAPANRPWVLYAADAGITRVVARRLGPQRTNSVEAAIEAVALIVRATTDALLHGEPMPSEEAPETSEVSTPWPVERLVHGTSGVRLSAAYVGTTFAKEKPWQQGLGLGAAWIWPSGSYLGLGFTIFERMHFDIPNGRFAVDRYPISLHAGLRFAVAPFTFIGELGLELEIRNRTTESMSEAQLEPKGPDQNAVFNICPKLETELAILPWLVAFGGVGLDFVVGNFPYTILMDSTEKTSISLEPYLIRLNLQLGIAFLH